MPASFCGPSRVARERALLALRRAAAEPSPGVWKLAKDQLKRESDGKCGYCEAKTSQVAHGDVEHHRPKTTYWWLAYCFHNYLYACQICNQTYKGSKFPIAGPRLVAPVVATTSTDAELDALAGRLAPDPRDAGAIAQFDVEARAELASIPDPYGVDPESLFSWRVDHTLREVEIQPRDASAEALRAFDAAEHFLGLNRDELKRVRYDTLKPALVMAKALASGRLDRQCERETADELRQMTSRSGQFAGMLRHVLFEVEGLML